MADSANFPCPSMAESAGSCPDAGFSHYFHSLLMYHQIPEVLMAHSVSCAVTELALRSHSVTVYLAECALK
jgi:hypothetical protein